MKLHKNQKMLIRHLIRFPVLDYKSCLEALNVDGEKDAVALSYAFRPLTKNRYLSKSKQGMVTVLKKGKELFPEESRLIAPGGNEAAAFRVLQVSRMAALLERCGVSITGRLPETDRPHFIPSACWRNLAPGILSTTRFVGMLLVCGKKYAVYDIGNGSMEWQVRAESSLFYTKYGSYETKADGMILICADGMREKVAENIIRQTMWSRRTLLDESYTERNRPVRFSRSPIKLRTQYEKAYLTTPSGLQKSLRLIYNEERIIERQRGEGRPLRDPKLGDFEAWPRRFFINPAFDLLKLVYFFSAVKSCLSLEQNSLFPAPELIYYIVMPRADLFILNLYPDVLRSGRVKVYAY